MTEMIRLTANKVMRAAHRDLSRNGELGRGLSVSSPPPVQRRFTPKPVNRQAPTQKELKAIYEGSDAIGLAATGTLEPSLRDALIGGVTNYIDTVERVVMRRQSLQEQANPLRDKAPAVPSNPGDPTPEWTRKNNGHVGKETVGKGEIVPVRRHRVRSVVEAHGDKLEMSHRSSLERFMQDATYVQRCRIANLHSSGGGGGERLGGLGNVAQRVRDGLARDQWVRSQLSPELHATANALVTRELTKPDGVPFSMEDFGSRMFPSVGDRNRRWGASAGLLLALAAQLSLLYPVCPVIVRRIDEDERRLEAAE